jgi:hypothetical protein
LGGGWIFAHLIGENGLSHVVGLHEYIFFFLASKSEGCVASFQWLTFGGAYVFACLVHVASLCLVGFRVILVDILFGEKRPTDEVASFDGF